MSEQQPTHFALDKLPVKLEGAANYITWCTYVKAALKGQNLYKHIAGQAPRPAANAEAKTQEEWTRRDEKAQSIIMLGVMPVMVNHIAGDMTAQEMWDSLAVQCRRKDLATRVSLMQQLFTARLRDAESVDKHISAMNDIRTQLSSIKKPIDDTVAAIALLLSVPAEVPQWEMFLRTESSRTPSDGKDDLSWDEVSAAMRAEASLQQQRDRTLAHSNSDAAVVAYAAAAATRVAKGVKQASGRPFCTHCNKPGHVVATCWTLHPELRNRRKGQTRDEVAMAVAVSTVNSVPFSRPNVGLWHVDSGASSHLTGNRAWFVKLSPCVPCTVTVADRGTLTCTQRGTVVLLTERHRITVHNVLFVPSLGVNLLSVSAIVNAGMRVRFTKTGCTIRTSRNKMIAQALAHDNVYTVQAIPEQSSESAAYSVTAGSSGPLNWTTAHARMGHLNPRAMQTMFDKGMAVGLTAPSAGAPSDIDHCAGCLAGKTHRRPIPTEPAAHRADQPLGLVHSDVCGPFEIKGRDNNAQSSKRYIITFIDDYSRFMWICLTSDKSASTVLDAFKRYRAYSQTYTGHELKVLRTDGGGEYINEQFNTVLFTLGIERQVTVAYTPQQNGVAERANRTIMEAARSMLHAAGLPLDFWEYAVAVAVYLRNRSPTKALAEATPYEAWRGEKPDLSHIRVFGCAASMHLGRARRSKLQPRATPVIFVGYATEAKGWLMYDPASSHKRTHVSRDVIFRESVAGSTLLTSAAVSAAEPAAISSTVSSSSSSSTTRAAEPVDISDRLSSIDFLHASDTESGSDDDVEPEAAEPRRHQPPRQPPASQHVAGLSPESSQRAARESPEIDGGGPASSAAATAVAPPLTSQSDNQPAARKQRKRLSRSEREQRNLTSYNALGNTERTDELQPRRNALYAFAVQVGETIGEPHTHREAVNGPHRVQWERAMQDELDSIKANDTYTLVALPAGRQAIGCKWVFKIKRHADGSVDRYKARLVAKGYSQLYGIDFTETFAPVVRFSSLRAILAIAASADYEIHQMDVKTAFLNGDLDEDIYMQQPDGYRAAGAQVDHVWKLNKSLYGLKQAGRAWNKKMDAALVELAFKPLQSDSCVYVHRDGNTVMFILLYVDDLLLVTNDTTLLSSTKKALCARFDMKDMGAAHFLLGVQIRRDRAKRQLYLSQAEYVRTILTRFGMQDCKPVASPMATGVKLLKSDPMDAARADDMSNVPYSSAVGALMYAALATRPDIAFVVTALCQFMAAPAISHWHAVKRVMRYLQGSQQRKLTYGWDGGRDQPLYGYSDSDWGNNVNDRRSFTGWVFLLHDGAVSWQSCKQPTVALSSVEAEYMAATQATREAVWWRAFMTELGSPPAAATTIYSDSQGSIALSKNPEHHKRTKHIDIQHHYVREQVAADSVALSFVGTEDMVADVLTKPLSAERHGRLTGRMGMC